LYVIVCSLISGDGIAIAASFVSAPFLLLLLLRDKIDVTGALRVVIFFVVAFLEEEDRADAAVGETVR